MFDKRIGWLGTFIVAVLGSLAAAVIYWQLARVDLRQPRAVDPVLAAVGSGQSSAEITGAPTAAPEPPLPYTQRAMAQLASVTRGTIYAADQEVLATDQTLDGQDHTRIYPDAAFANLVGYVSGLRIGVTGLEYAYNQSLLGLDLVDNSLNQIVHQPTNGSDLLLTIDPDLQRRAEQDLGQRAGAIVVLDGHSGAVLAMVSSPHYDPARVLDPDYVASLLDCADPACRAPFLNRATQALYPPGSTWKTVTLITALDSGQVTPQTVFDFGEPVKGPNGSYYVYKVGGAEVVDPNHSESRLDLGMAYAKSANAAFAQLGDQMPADTLLEYATRLGFGPQGEQRFPLEIERSLSQVAVDPAQLAEDPLLRATTAIGQGEVLVTPLDMARLVLAVVNHGDAPLPYLVDSIRSPLGWTSRGMLKGKWVRGLMTAETADTVRQMMITAVESGSGGRAAVPNLVVGGKTGTAQLGGSAAPHAWFIGFAEQDQQLIVAAVLIENGGEGSVAAAPVFSDLAGFALGQ